MNRTRNSVCLGIIALSALGTACKQQVNDVLAVENAESENAITMSAAAVQSLSQSSATAGKSIVSYDEFKTLLKQAKFVVVPIGNSGGLYSESAGAVVEQELALIFSMARGRKTMVLMDFNHEGKPLLDINRAVSEVTKSLGNGLIRVGMTSKKVLDGKYAPNALPEIKNLMVSSADDYDTGFHPLVVRTAAHLPEIAIEVAILGGGQISEKQGQAWISAVANGIRNVKVVLDIELMTGKAEKYYNAAARLADANYAVLQKALANGSAMIFRNGQKLMQMPTQDELKMLISKADEVAAAAKAAAAAPK